MPIVPKADENEAIAALAAAGYNPAGPAETVSVSGRSCLRTIRTDRGTAWIKHGYALPPGEGRVLRRLAERWPDRLPRLIAAWGSTVIMEPLAGRELAITDPLDAWTTAASTIASLAAGEMPHASMWLAMGVRDRRPPVWGAALRALRASPVVGALDPTILDRLDRLLPELDERYREAFRAPATLVSQDSGCCNIHIVAAGKAILFDWADVVVGHPVFSCDRLLDQTPAAYREAVIAAFCEPLNLEREEFNGMRRLNVIHEILRYHDELPYLPVGDAQHQTLAKAVRSQIRVLVDHEDRRRTKG